MNRYAMAKQLLFLFLLLTIQLVNAQNIPLPNGYEIIEKVSGDLDKDSIAELVVIYNTGKSDDSGLFREIQVFKLSNKQWVLWKKSSAAILQSEEGGMMGDPYQETLIQNGVLLIVHAGGNSWKWGHTDKYRFQKNEFALIGYSNDYGKPCEEWISFDFNVSTGKIVYKKEYERCDELKEEQVIYKTETETFSHKGILLNLGNRQDQEIKIVSPRYKAEFYL